MDYFETFDLPRKLIIDTEVLEKKFYAQSRKLHPDRFAGKSVQEQDFATQQSSRLNDAYRTLKDPVARTQHLLALEGVQLEEQSSAATNQARSSGEAKKQAVPPELLEEVFEFNMQLQEMKMAHEMGEEAESDTRLGLEAARANFTSKLGRVDEELRRVWAQWDDSGSDAEKQNARDGLVDVLNRRNYIRNLVRDVNEVLEQ